jgi:L-lactate utilization protein LutB
MHVILVDNGRSARLGMKRFRHSLKCIRCAACMNTCPVYRRSGGSSYGSTYMTNRHHHDAHVRDSEVQRASIFVDLECKFVTTASICRIDRGSTETKLGRRRW